MHSLGVLDDDLRDHVDVELCYHTLLYGFWGQIAAYRSSSGFHAHHSSSSGTRRPWLQSQHQELHDDLSALSAVLLLQHHHTTSPPSAHLALVLELLLMALHVSPDELQRFAGKLGEDEARRAAASLEEGWVRTREARHAAWHAGQVLLGARRLPPASLRGFGAIAVYLASLALWAYGLLSYHPRIEVGEQQQQQQQQDPVRLSPGSVHQRRRGGSSCKSAASSRPVYLDGEETMDTKAFVQAHRGVPALSTSSGAVIELLSNPAGVLAIARDIFRENFPVRSEPLPPLVKSLSNLLADLENGAGGMSSRVGHVEYR